ncbi:MAG: hypothetical protein JO211_17135 [Acidobacteriaceae bacterium]|nr:hypothetical protein [Acidobacteriaceae bacterium]
MYNKLLKAAFFGTCLCSLSRGALIGNDINGVLYDVNQTTGAATNARPTGISNLVGIAFNSSGVLYGLSMQPQTESLYTINPSTGFSTLIGSSSVSNTFTDSFVYGDLRFNPASGTLFGVEYQSVPFSTPVPKGFTINPATGAISNLFNLPCFNNSCVVDYSALAINSAGQLYILDTASLDPYGHLIAGSGNPFVSTLNVNVSGPLGILAGMDFDPATGRLYVADGGTGAGDDLYTLNPSNGNLTLVGSLGLTNGLAGLAFTPVPEPAAFSLLVLGAAVLFAARKLNRG